MRSLRSRSSGLAAKKKVNASSSEEQPAAHGASDAAVSAPAPRSRLRRPNGLSTMVLPILRPSRPPRRLCLMSLVPDVSVVRLRWQKWQCENGPAQASGVSSNVDRVNAVVGSNADLQHDLRASALGDHDARGTVDEHDGTAPRTLGESTGLLGDVGGPAQLGRYILRNQRPIDPAHYSGSEQLEQSRDITATGGRQKSFHHLEGLGWRAAYQSPAGPAREFFRGRRRPVQQTCNRLERHSEHIVQHKSNALRR